MADSTRPRGTGDAPASLSFVRTASRRAVRIAFVIALVLHLPFVPNPLSRWIELWMSLGNAEITDYDGGETIIPLDLDLLKDDPVAEQAPPAPPPTDGDPGAAPIASSKPVAEAADAGVPDAGVPDADVPDADRPDAGHLDAGPADAGPLDASPLADAGPHEPRDGGSPFDDAGTPLDADAGSPRLREPLAAAGEPGNLANKDPNVQVLIAGDRIRKHDLGPWFGRILTTIPEWQSFFKDTAIDPIQDFDHLLIAGPQFRNSSQVVAIMDYRVPEATIHGAIDVLVKRTRGKWIAGAPVPAARAKAHRAERIFAIVPQKRLLVVLPASEKDSLSKLKNIKSFNKSSPAGIVISMLTPGNAFRNVSVFNYHVPKTLKWMRLTVTPTKDGGADVALRVGDVSAEDAVTHAAELTKVLNENRRQGFGFLRVDVLDEVTFTADGDTFWTRLHVQSKQLKLIMGLVEQGLKDQAASRKQPRPD